MRAISSARASACSREERASASARRLLLRLEVREPRAFGTELLGGAHAIELALLELHLQRAEASLDLTESPLQPVDLCRRLLGLAARVDQAAIGFALLGARFEL